MTGNGIGIRIEEYLRKRGLSQRQLAEKTDTTEVSISRYVNGYRIPSSIMIGAIAKALNCTTDYLIFGGKTMSKSNKTCPFCHIGKDGDYALYQFTNGKNQSQNVKISFYDGELTVIMSRLGAETDIQLSTPIHYCPVCGRDFGTMEDVEQ